jgi:hypothetical protein
MVIYDIDPAAAPAEVGVAASSDALHNVKRQRPVNFRGLA